MISITFENKDKLFIKQRFTNRPRDKHSYIHTDTHTSRQRNTQTKTKGQTDKQAHRALENRSGTIVEKFLQDRKTTQITINTLKTTFSM